MTNRFEGFTESELCELLNGLKHRISVLSKVRWTQDIIKMNKKLISEINKELEKEAERDGD